MEPEIHYCIHKWPSLVSIMSQLIPSHRLQNTFIFTNDKVLIIVDLKIRF